MEGYVQGALRKELLIAPFMESVETATLERSYWWVLPVRGTIYLNIVFLQIYSWWKVMYRVLY